MIINEIYKLKRNNFLYFTFFIFISVIILNNLFLSFDTDIRNDNKYIDRLKREYLDYKDINFFNEVESFKLNNKYEEYKFRKEKLNTKIVNLKIKYQMNLFDNKEEINKQINELQSSKNIDTKISYNKYVEKYLLNNISFYLYLITLVSIFYAISIQDIRKNNIKLLKTMENGGVKLYLSKTLAFLIISSLLLIIWFVIDIFALIINKIDILSNLQGISFFIYSGIRLNIFYYLIINFIFKYIFCISIITVLYLIYLVTKNLAYTLILMTLSVFIQYYLKYYNLLGYNTDHLRRINIFSLIDIPLKDGKEEFIVIFVLLIIFITAQCISIFLFNKNYINRKNNLKLISVPIKNIFLHQFYYVFFRKKAIILLFFVITFMIYSYNSFNIVKNYDEELYYNIKSQYFGIIESRLLERIDNDIEEGNKSFEIVNELLKKKELNEEDRKIADSHSKNIIKLKYLPKIKDEIRQLSDNNALKYYDYKYYKLLYREENIIPFLIDNSIIFLLIIIFVIFCVQLDNKKLIRKYHLTYMNNNLRIFNQIIISYLISIALVLLFNIMNYFKISKVFNLSFITEGINNIFNTSATMSFSTFAIINLILQLLIYITLTNITYLISWKFSKINSFIILNLILIGSILLYFVFPIFSYLSIMRFHILENYSYLIITLIVLILINIISVRKIFTN